MKTYDLSWGDPKIVRQALVETFGHKFGNDMPLIDMGYTDFIGNTKLIEQLKKLAKRQSGRKPKHLFVTNGATGALHAALYAITHNPYWRINYEVVVTDKRYYPIYPAIIHQANLSMLTREGRDELLETHGNCYKGHQFISLIASPSAPEGLVYPFEKADIWDAAYASRTYSSGSHIPVSHKIMCGSLAKTLGLAGLRLGWVSTDDDDLADKLNKYVSTTYVGLSKVSMEIAEDVLDTLDFDSFEFKASNYLDDNREEMQKLLAKFGSSSVPNRGMFAILELGKSERKALERANVKWQPGSSWGEDDSWARLSLGQSREITRAAVKAVLK